jgi:O-antigen/teichoic acid export membrane protein
VKKSNFIQGAMIATVSIIICKILGLIYVIPFYSIIGSKGGALYSYAYSIYSIFLSLSTCGIPVAVSRLISEYNALQEYSIKERIYKMASHIIILIGLVSFILIFIFAENIAYMFIGNMQGGNTINEVTIAIRVISVALLVVPQQSILRGYLEGHKIMTAPSISNIIEQFVRVIIIVVGSYVVVNILHLPKEVAVYVAIFSATIAALCSYIYLKVQIKRNKKLFITRDNSSIVMTKKDILKKILMYAIPFVIIDFVQSLYGIVDSITVVKTLVSIGYTAPVAETAYGVVATWGAKLNMIVMSISLGLTTSLVPNLSSSFAKKDFKGVNKNINESFSLLFFLTIPMSLGISFLAKPVWTVFYGYDKLCIDIFKIIIIQIIVYGLYTTIINISQTINNTKLSLISLLLSFLAKLLLNSPMMIILKNIGVEGYYGSVVTNFIVEGLTFIIVLLFIKRKYNFSFKPILISLLKSVVCASIMLLVLYVIKIIIPLNSTSRLISIYYIIIYALIGAPIYIFFAFKSGLINNVFGVNTLKSLIKKFKH